VAVALFGHRQFTYTFQRVDCITVHWKLDESSEGASACQPQRIAAINRKSSPDFIENWKILT
jgi:hypothetical protein